jgi:hypothetical protein
VISCVDLNGNQDCKRGCRPISDEGHCASGIAGLLQLQHSHGRRQGSIGSEKLVDKELEVG